MEEHVKETLRAYDPKELLIFVLNHYQIEIKEVRQREIDVEGDFMIEVEGFMLYKLYWNDTVLAPFDDLDKLCAYISMELHRG
jgi:hypothetical protein